MKFPPLTLWFILRRLRHLAAGLLTLGLAVVPLFGQAPASGPARQTLHGHVPAAVSRLQPVGRVPASQTIRLAIALPLRNQQALTDLLQQISDPARPNYRHYLTPEQFTDAFGPSKDDYQALQVFARNHGLVVSTVHPNRLLLDVEAPAAEIEKALHLRLQLFQHPTEGRTFYAPDVDPSLDLTVPVLHISGLDTFALPRPSSLHAKPIDPSTPITPNAGSGPSGTYMGYDFRNAYAPGVTLTGVGQVVGLVEFDGYFPADISKYTAKAGLPNVPLQDVLIDGFDGSAGFNNVEVALDIEVAIAMAPGLSKIIVYEAPNPSPWVDMLNRMATDNLAQQLSCSWFGGPPNPAADQIFQQMAAQGQSFFTASGDDDAFTGSIPFPSDNPFITVVGGTTLTTGTGSSYASEKVWNWGGGIGGAGGISTYYPIPSWQQGISMTANKGSTTMRNIPDVALTADNIFIVADNGTQETVGGTSAATPLWAAFTALINQQSGANCGSGLGFLNPAIYGIGKGTSFTNNLHDITTGNNFSPASPSKFAATIGFDLCTGWGSPKGAALIATLGGTGSGSLTLAVNPASGSGLIGYSNQPVVVTIQGVTNATVTATIPGVPNLTFTNSSAAPSVYTASFQVPAPPASFTMTLSATATNRIGVTNNFYYTSIPAPPNDRFANATKVPAPGAVYPANNRFATTETNEPPHDGITSAAGSLWWSWIPTVTTNVLLDTTFSRVNTVVAVYTGDTLSNLQEVASTSSNLGQHQPALLTFSAQAFQTYQIAVASPDTNSLGYIHLAIAPGGQSDTTPPTVAVASPQSGLTVSNQAVVLTGTASDSAPNFTGVNQVVVTLNGCTGVPVSGTTNWTASAALQPGLNILQATAIDEGGNASASVTVQLNYFVVNPQNDFFANAIALTGASGSNSMNTPNATKEVGEPNHAGNAGGKSVWWSFQTNVDGVLTLSTTNSTFDTLLALYTGSQVSALTPIASSDDAYQGVPGGFSLINQGIRANQTYSIAVDGYDGASGTNWLTYSFQPAPVFQLTTGTAGPGTVQVATTNALGGVLLLSSTSADVVSNSTVTLTPTASTYYQFAGWDGDVVSSDSPLTVVVRSNITLTAHFVPVVFSDGFESGTLASLPWSTSGNQHWFVQTNVVATGQYAARSGAIHGNQSTSLLLTTNFGDGVASFSFRVSSEPNFDMLAFSVDGIQLSKWWGDTGWQTYSFALSIGSHTLQWTYSKDSTINVGLDAAFLDNIILPIVVPSSSASAAHLGIQQQGDGSVSVSLLGQTNQVYVLQVSTNLLNWQNASTNFASAGYLLFPDPGSLTNQIRFYRAVAP